MSAFMAFHQSALLALLGPAISLAHPPPQPHNSLLPLRIFQGNRLVVGWEPVDQELHFSRLAACGRQRLSV
ncbi:hypothetical protein CSPX01_16782 [Colletotrichum filicis]|nr:hypothetical protein CSPX01_16782 [Colletotrichum filicis]